MTNIKNIIENPDLIQKGADKKHVKIDIQRIISLYQEKKTHLQIIEEVKAEQNKTSKLIPTAQKQDKGKLLKKMTDAKKKIKDLEPKLQEIETQLTELLANVPNPPLKSVPEGKSEDDNQTIKIHGQKPKFDFEPKTHTELGKSLDIIDMEKGAITSGARFYYLKNEAVMLEFALLQHVMNKLVNKGFSPIIPPLLVKEEAMFATGFFPADKNEIYNVNPNEDNLFLIGTSEVPLTMLHANEILEQKNLPIRYCGFSTCFRREAGSYGKDTTGIIRVHQFDKIEMFSFCHPANSETEHELILSIEEEIMQELNLHYRVVNICGGDLGLPAAKKYDIEVWIPTQNKFRELTSCSNCTDFQAQRANIKFKDENEKKQYVHTLNGTGIAIARALVAIIENNQTKTGNILIPEILQKYMNGQKEIKPKV